MVTAIDFVVIVVLLYLVECLRKTAPNELVIDRATAHGFKLRVPCTYPSNGEWGWLLLNPLRPGGPVYSLRPASFALTSSGVISFGDSPAEFDYVPYTRLNEITFPVPAEALTELALLPGSERKRRVRMLAEEKLATASINQSAGELQRCTARIRITIVALAVLGFGLFPVLSLAFGLRAMIIPAVIAVVICTVATAVTYYRAWRKLRPNTARHVVYGALVKFVLYPISALRCVDQLSYNHLAAYDPIAVAMATCGRTEALRLVKKEMVICTYSALPTDRDGETLRALEEYRKSRLDLLRYFLTRHGLDPPDVGAQPDPIYPHAQSFCPGCGAQYVHKDGECTDCLTIRLQSLSPETREETMAANEVSIDGQ
jgi:hypothetical protein